MKYFQLVFTWILISALCSPGYAQENVGLEIITETPMHDAGKVLIEAKDMISSDKKISGNSQVSFRAGQMITLKPGFEVKEGSVFQAGISISEPTDAESAAENADPAPASESYLNIYPNPSEGIFNIAVDAQKIASQYGSGSYQMVLYNTKGEVVANLSGNQNKLYNFNFSYLTKGVYYLKLFTVATNSSVQPPENKELIFRQIIIE